MQELNGLAEIASRERRGANTMKFGIQFLDDVTKGIFPSDLILLGARSGAGKTQLCCEILNANVRSGRRVLYVALEAELFEIESRLKFKFFMDAVRQDYKRPSIEFDLWMLGRYVNQFPEQEQRALEQFNEAYNTKAFVQYKGDKFGVNELIETVCRTAPKVDLLIIDHVHYFDFDDELENRALKEIAKTARTLALEQAKPILLVSHMRKPDRKVKSICPDMDEFHGTSELFKIATKVITLAPGKTIRNNAYETFMRVPKNRFNGGCSHFVARTFYSPKGGGYETGYELGWADAEEFEDIGRSAYPRWAEGQTTLGGNIDTLTPRPPNLAAHLGRKVPVGPGNTNR